MIRSTFLTFLSVLTLGFAASLPAQDRIVVGPVTTDAGELGVPVYNIAVVADSDDVASLAKRVLSTHGSFNLKPPSGAHFVFNFSKQGANAVSLSIKGGSNFSGSFTGADWQEALMKACDAATKATVGTPGYFSGKLAFSYSKGGANTEIYMADMGFQKVVALTADRSDSIMPHFSRDGSKISYTGYFRSGYMDLYEINLRTKSRRVLASYKGSNTGGAYSPDGSKIAFILSTTGNAEIWVGNSDGKNMKRLTKTSATESSVSFSPDGRRLVFSSDPNGAPRIYTMSVDGGSPAVVPTAISGYCSEPAWNPADPSKLAFTAAVNKGFQVALFDFNAKKSEFITGGANTSWPVWTNDGRHLICAKTQGKTKSLWVIDTATKKQTRLHSAEFGSAGEPTFYYPAY